MQFLNWSRRALQHFLLPFPWHFSRIYAACDDMLVLNVHEAHDCHWNAFTPSFYDNTNDALTPKARKMTHGISSQSKWKDANWLKSAFNTAGGDAMKQITQISHGWKLTIFNSAETLRHPYRSPQCFHVPKGEDLICFWCDRPVRLS